MDFEPFSVPVALIDTESRQNKSFFSHIWDQMSTPGFMFKHREDICAFDLILHLSDEPYNNTYLHYFYQMAEFMYDKYLVIIRFKNKVLLMDHEFEELWTRMTLSNHKIYIWAVVEYGL